ncbi:uncharacterized protein RJT20DRAFT_129178 [Scheffersomyces xylosifermentans]|uniref:uncharacterized protein n=1 Tax=Scheffersomyces xylosifermentans TaxID=1304137 RepID=UPI00315D7E36
MVMEGQLDERQDDARQFPHSALPSCQPCERDNKHKNYRSFTFPINGGSRGLRVHSNEIRRSQISHPSSHALEPFSSIRESKRRQQSPLSPPTKNNINEQLFGNRISLAIGSLGHENDGDGAVEDLEYSQLSAKKSLKMIRSNGKFRTIHREFSPVEFPYEDFYNSTRSAVIRQISGSDSSYFDIETIPETDDFNGDSPLPFPNLQSMIQSPHEPPFDVTGLQPGGTVRGEIVERQNRIFPLMDYFQEFMEERLVRWRPSDSHHNNEISIAGRHAYQQDNYCHSKAEQTTTIVSSLTGWLFKRKVVELVPESISDPILIEGTSDSLQRSPTMLRVVRPTSGFPNYSQIIEEMNLKPNSSISCLVNSPKRELAHSSNATFMIADEPEPITEPLYTPHALAFDDYALNYMKSDQHQEVEVIGGSAIVNSLDEDVRQMIQAVDFFIDCFCDSWNCISTTARTLY